MARITESFGLGVTQIAVGTSAPLLILPREKQLCLALKYVSGGSLEIFSAATGATSGSVSGVSWGLGYLLGTTEIFNIQGPTRFYLAATGSTAVAHLAIGLSDPG